MSAVFRRRSSSIVLDKRSSRLSQYGSGDLDTSAIGKAFLLMQSETDNEVPALVDNVGHKNLATLSNVTEDIICEELQRR
jgi:hypothetical protein